jgi:hypothetical protein
MIFGFQNIQHFIGILIFSIVFLFFLYSRCESHEFIKRKTAIDRLKMNYYEKREYQNKLFCSFNKVSILFVAILIPFVLLKNNFQYYASILFLLLLVFVYSLGIF